MYISVSIIRTNVPIPNDLISIDVASDMTIQDLKAIIESEIHVKPIHQHLFFNNIPLRDDEATFFSAGIRDGDMLALHVRAPTSSSMTDSNTQQLLQQQLQQHSQQLQSQLQSPAQPSSSSSSSSHQQQQSQQSQSQSQPLSQQTIRDAETVRLRLLGDPVACSAIRASNPGIIAALHDPTRFAQLFNYERERRVRAEQAKQAKIAALNADPFNVDAQREIEELIRQEAVDENMQAAMEHTPEAFGRVSMLYIPVEVNNTPIKAFVDSGAQVTIMSPTCAEKCNIMRLVDRRYGGVAKGVGTANILGRVHTAQIKIGPIYLSSSFTVMEGKHIDLLIGLDMLKRYQACIDLKDMVLRIGNEVVVPFLAEKDIPKEHEEELFADEPIVRGEDGAMIGARTGAVTQQAQSSPPGAASASASASGTTPRGSSGHPASTSAAAGSSGLATGPPSSSGVSLPPSRFPEATVRQVMELGFTRGEAIQALEAADGDVDGAVGFLL